MSDTYVLVHGAWHTGQLLEDVAAFMRQKGVQVLCPTLQGNRVGDDRARIGLSDAAQSLIDYIGQNQLDNIRLVAHSYGGMVITEAYAKLANRIRRLVYVNAFVPNPGESLVDLVPPMFAGLFQEIAANNGGALMLPFPIWREAFINDADLALAQSAYDKLNAHPYKTFTDKVTIDEPIAAAMVGKSYVNCTEDAALPHSYPWHPRLSERLGLFRYVECAGSHEAWFTRPADLATAIIRAGRD